MRGIIRIYQNGNTVDVEFPDYNTASPIFHQLAHVLDIPDCHFSIWSAKEGRDLVAERRKVHA